MTESREHEDSGRQVLFYDITKQLKQAHASGLNRVSKRLMEALSKRDDVCLNPVKWSSVRRSYVSVESNLPVGKGNPDDIFFSPEIFSLSERPFSRGWMEKFQGKTGCLFYDAIPHDYPGTTWPKSVRRFPKLISDLSRYSHVFFISENARKDAFRAAKDLNLPKPEGRLLALGCDYREKRLKKVPTDECIILQVGIIEPRKGQALLLEACEKLWDEGAVFQLVLLGRVNPHFGKPIVAKIKEMQASGRKLIHQVEASDDELAKWHEKASLQVSPSLAEGFGLPVVEALWAGCPVLCSEQPVLNTLPSSAGIKVLEEVTHEEIYNSLGSLVRQPELLKKLADEIDNTNLPTWSDTAEELIYSFRDSATS